MRYRDEGRLRSRKEGLKRRSRKEGWKRRDGKEGGKEKKGKGGKCVCVYLRGGLIGWDGW